MSELDKWTLYLGTREHKDWLHPNVQLTAVRYNKQIEFSLISKGPIQAQVLVLRSPIVAAVGMIEPSVLAPAEALWLTLADSGCCEKTAPNYRSDIRMLIGQLHPRSIEITPEILNEKMSRNVFGSPTHARLLRSGSFINHSCAPNCIVEWDPVLHEAKFLTIIPIPIKSEINISYLPWPIDCLSTRQQLLQAHGIQECLCLWCQTEIPPSLVLQYTSYRPKKHCWWCGIEASKQCQACKLATFCSADCQTADWPIHRLICCKLKM